MNVYFLIFIFTYIYLVLIAADDNEITPYQSFCDPSTNNGECSDNFDCRCSTIVPTGERICTPQVTCSSVLPCNSDDICNKTNTICVVDNRCNGQRLCYPVSLTSPDICPPLATNDNIYN